MPLLLDFFLKMLSARLEIDLTCLKELILPGSEMFVIDLMLRGVSLFGTCIIATFSSTFDSFTPARFPFISLLLMLGIKP